LFWKCPKNNGGSGGPPAQQFMTSTFGLSQLSASPSGYLPGVNFGDAAWFTTLAEPTARQTPVPSSRSVTLTDQVLAQFHQISTPSRVATPSARSVRSAESAARSSASSVPDSTKTGQQTLYPPPWPPVQPADLPLERSGMRDTGNQLTQLSRTLFQSRSSQASAAAHNEVLLAVARPDFDLSA
jgi:hypothetical protein